MDRRLNANVRLTKLVATIDILRRNYYRVQFCVVYNTQPIFALSLLGISLAHLQTGE